MERKYYLGGEGKPPIWIQPIIENGRMFDADFFNFTNMYYFPKSKTINYRNKKKVIFWYNNRRAIYANKFIVNNGGKYGSFKCKCCKAN